MVLVILDLNGLLLHRLHKRDYVVSHGTDDDAPPHVRFGPFLVWKRPHVDEFLAWLLSENHQVAIWTSARRDNAEKMVHGILPPEIRQRLLFVWGQEKCNQYPDPEARGGVRFTKPLSKVIEAFPSLESGVAVLIDDSVEKTVENAPGLHFDPGTWTRENVDDNFLLPPNAPVCQWLAKFK